MTKKKAIVLVAVGELSLNQIKWAKELGLITIVTDRNPNAKSLKLADVPIVVDGKNENAIINKIRTIKDTVDIIGVYSDIDLALTVSKVSRVFGAPNIPVKTAKELESKISMKKKLITNKIPVARYLIAKNSKEVSTASKKIKLPVVIKPPNSSGAQGVTIVIKPEQLKEAYYEAKKFAKKLPIIVEEYLEGSLHDVNILLYNNRYFKCGISVRFQNALPHAYHTGSIDPTQIGQKSQDVIYKYTYLAAKAFNIKFGPFKADVILTKTGPKIIEVAPRFHGDIITSWTTPLSRGTNPIKVYFKLLVTNEIDRKMFKPTKNEVAGFKVITAKPGKIKEIKNLEEVLKMKGIRKISLKKKVGGIVRHYKNNDDVCGFIIANSKNITSLTATLEKAERKLVIETV